MSAADADICEPVGSSASPVWAGVPMFVHARSTPVRQVGLHIPVPTLVLWKSGQTDVDLRGSAGKGWRFQGRARRFDLYPASEFSKASTGAGAFSQLAIPLHSEFLHSMLRRTDAELGLTQPRFQFSDAVLERLARGLMNHAREGRELGHIYTQSLSVAMVDRLAELASGPTARTRATSPLSGRSRKLIIDLIEETLGNDLRLQDLAALSGRRISDFLRAFRQSFGISPHQYVLERRIGRGKRLLRGDKSLTDIAIELGFASQANFGAAFKTRTGMTPGTFRRDNAAPGTT